MCAVHRIRKKMKRLNLPRNGKKVVGAKACKCYCSDYACSHNIFPEKAFHLSAPSCIDSPIGNGQRRKAKRCPMSDPKGQGDQNTTPDDIASLYSWANLHGAKYRDFSASRAQVRESSRLRVQEATEAERQQLGAPVQATTPEARRADQPESAAEARPEAEWETQQGAQWSAIVGPATGTSNGGATRNARACSTGS